MLIGLLAGGSYLSILREHSMHAERDIVLAIPSVRPSVCPSVTLWNCV